MQTNSVEELPEGWREIVNSTEVPKIYIKFVDDATNLREAEERSKAAGLTEVSQAEFMHLYYLSAYVNVIQNSQDLLNGDNEVPCLGSSTLNTTNPIPLVPVKENDTMLYFPYKDQGQRVDEATKDLLIFGQSLFQFIEKTNYLRNFRAIGGWPKEKDSIYKSAGINRESYLH